MKLVDILTSYLYVIRASDFGIFAAWTVHSVNEKEMALPSFAMRAFFEVVFCPPRCSFALSENARIR